MEAAFLPPFICNQMPFAVQFVSDWLSVYDFDDHF